MRGGSAYVVAEEAELVFADLVAEEGENPAAGNPCEGADSRPPVLHPPPPIADRREASLRSSTTLRSMPDLVQLSLALVAASSLWRSPTFAPLLGQWQIGRAHV